MTNSTRAPETGQYGTCPYCRRALGETDMDTRMCACGALFENEDKEWW